MYVKTWIVYGNVLSDISRGLQIISVYIFALEVIGDYKTTN